MEYNAFAICYNCIAICCNCINCWISSLNSTSNCSCAIKEICSKIELEIPGETPTVDKTVQAKASKQDKIIKDYQRLKDLMQTELDMYKSFESPENKELAKERLKKLTPEFQAAKKAYEKLKGVKI